MEVCNLYTKSNYLNKNIDLLVNKIIIEYDLKSANTSLCKEYNLLPIETIKEIESKPKKERVVTIGKLMRKDKKFNEGLKDAFTDIRKRFFIDNDITEDDVLSIKKDAIFCLKKCTHVDFGQCLFVEKNIYTSYMYLNKLELYYNRRGISFDKPKLDIKGIDDSVIEKHNGYMINFLNSIFNHLESSDQKTLYRYIMRFFDKYKRYELDTEYYREFNQLGYITMSNSDVNYDDVTYISDNMKHDINIDYNFFNILLPIIKKIM